MKINLGSHRRSYKVIKGHKRSFPIIRFPISSKKSLRGGDGVGAVGGYVAWPVGLY